MTTARRKASTDAMAAARPFLEARCGGNCERCGAVLRMVGDAPLFEAHHRLMRSRGGRDGLANLVALCGQCHRWVHNRPHPAEQEGYMLPSMSNGEPTDPAVCIVWLRHWPCLLADDGTFEELEQGPF